MTTGITEDNMNHIIQATESLPLDLIQFRLKTWPWEPDPEYHSQYQATNGDWSAIISWTHLYLTSPHNITYSFMRSENGAIGDLVQAVFIDAVTKRTGRIWSLMP